MRRTGRYWLLLLGAPLLMAEAPEAAQQAHIHPFRIEAQPMANALTRFSEQSDLRILYPFEDVRSMRAKAVRGRLDDRLALETLIAGTALRIASMRGNVVVLKLPDRIGQRFVRDQVIGDTDTPAHPASALNGPPANEPIVVTGRRISQSVDALGEGRITQTTALTRKALLSAPPGISGLKMLEYLPGFNVQTDGPLGLYEFGNSVQVRAFNLDEIGFTVDGIPMGRSDAFGGSPVFRYVDNENLAKIEASSGAASVGEPGYASLGPMVRYSSIAPQQNPGLYVSQSLGSNSLNRTFLRGSSGRVGPFTGYVSYTRLRSDVWRGAGTIRRSHWEALLHTDLGARAWLRFKFVANAFHDFDSPSMTRAQYESDVPDLDGRTGRDRGYVATIPKLPETVTGIIYSNPGYADYYGNAFNARNDKLYGATLHIAPQHGTALDVTTYHEDKHGSGASPDTYANSLIYYTQQAIAGLDVAAPRGLQYGLSTMSGQRSGALAKAQVEWQDHAIEAGLWYEDDRYHRRQLRLNHTGGAPDGAVLDDEVVYYRRDYQSHRRALQYWLRDRWTPGQGPLTLEAGFKGLNLDYRLTGMRDFNDYALADGTSGWGPQSGHGHWFASFLPSLGGLYRLDDGRTQVFASYTRSMAMPKGMDAIASVAFAGSASFAPIPKAERARNIEIGIRTNQPHFFATASLYQTRFDHQISPLSLPLPGSSGDLETYYTNVGTVEAHGFEGSATVKPAFLHGKAYFAGTMTWSDATFRHDLPDGTPTAGKRLPDSARWIASGTVTVEPTRWALVSLSAHYTGRRYADYTNTQSVSPMLVVDAYIDVGRPRSVGPLQGVRARLNINNLFDRNTLSFLYPTVTGAAYYRPLAPRTLQLTLSGEF